MQPSEDDRILAALAHASIVANVVNLGGIIATALIWTMQRERSPYVRAHALQALVYQGIVLLGTITLSIFWVSCLLLSLIPAFLRPDLYSSPPQLFWLALICVVVPVGFVGLAVLAGLYAAYQTYHGVPFRYPIAGRLVRRELPVVAGSHAPPPLSPIEAPSLVVSEPSVQSVALSAPSGAAQAADQVNISPAAEQSSTAQKEAPAAKPTARTRKLAPRESDRDDADTQ